MTRGLAPLRALGVAALLLVGLSGCGGPSAGGPTPRGASDARRSVPVELDLRFQDGSFLALGDLRGAPVLLFLFTTFDNVSQANIRPLRCLTEGSPELNVLGIAVEPSARILIGPYADVLEPSFELTFDPEGLVRRGRSALGAVDVVPTFVLLDERGRLRRRHTGFLDCDGLRSFVGR